MTWQEMAVLGAFFVIYFGLFIAPIVIDIRRRGGK